MKNLFRIIAAILVLSTLFSLCACSGNGKKEEETKKKDEVTTADKETEKDKDDESTAAEDTTDAEETTEADTTEADTTADETTKAPQTQAVVTTAPQTQAVTNPQGNEIIGQGSKDTPYLEIPAVSGSSMTLTTVPVPAGKALHYGIQRIGGLLVTINNANAYVICNGQRYDAQNGKVSFVAPNALASDFVYLEIGNKGGSAVSFTLSFTNLAGSVANPVIIKSLSTVSTISLAAGDEDGYTYKYYAEKSGKIRFYVKGNVDSIISVTNNRNSIQRNSDLEGEGLSDAQGTYIEIDVNSGDELVIVVSAKPDRRNKIPAATITWNGKYV